MSEKLLLAIDLGLRTGLAYFAAEGSEKGTLRRFGSKHFGSRTTLRRGAAGMLRAAGTIAHLVMEGDAQIAHLWAQVATSYGATWEIVSPDRWRRELLGLSDLDSRSWKARADHAAREVIAHSRLRVPNQIRHDAAEAILIGAWWCQVHSSLRREGH